MSKPIFDGNSNADMFQQIKTVIGSPTEADLEAMKVDLIE